MRFVTKLKEEEDGKHMTKDKVVKWMEEQHLADNIIKKFKREMIEEGLAQMLEVMSVDEHLKGIQEGGKTKKSNPRYSYIQRRIIVNPHNRLEEIDAELYNTTEIREIIETCGLKYDANGNKSNCFGICKETGEPVIYFKKESKDNIKKYSGCDLISGQKITAAMLILDHIGNGDFEEHLKNTYGIGVEPIREAKEEIVEEQVTFVVKNNVTYKDNGKTLKLFMDCAFEPKFIEQGEDGTYLTFDIVSNKYNGEFNRRETIHLAHFSDHQELNLLLMPEFAILGSENELMEYKDYITSNLEGVRYRNLLDSTGLHYLDDQWLYVDSLGCFDKEGRHSEEDYVAALAENPRRALFRDVEKINGEEMREIWYDLFAYNRFSICSNLLLSIVTMYMKEVHQNFGRMTAPNLHLSGRNDGDKYEVLKNVINPLLGLKDTSLWYGISGLTAMDIAELSSVNNTLPITFTRMRYLDLFEDLLRAYDENVEIVSPFIFVYEDRTNENRLPDIHHPVSFNRPLTGPRERKALSRFEKSEVLLNKLGKRILLKIMELDKEKYLNLLNRAKESRVVKRTAKAKYSWITDNTIQLVSSLLLLEGILDDLSLKDELMPFDMKDRIMDSIVSTI